MERQAVSGRERERAKVVKGMWVSPRPWRRRRMFVGFWEAGAGFVRLDQLVRTRYGENSEIAYAGRWRVLCLVRSRRWWGGGTACRCLHGWLV